jgi:hypothetical protein
MTSAGEAPKVARGAASKRRLLATVGAWWMAAIAASLAVALIATRVLYTTRLGAQLIDAIPESFWRQYHRAVGLEMIGDVEKVEDADGILVFLVTASISLALIAVARVAWKRRAERHA